MNISAAYYEDEKYIWCTSYTDTYLYRLDKTTAIMEEVMPLLDETYIECAFGNILYYNNFLVLVPTCADRIVLVNLLDFSKSYISVPATERRIGSSKFNFWTGVIHKDKLFLFGCSYPAILKIDLIMKTVEVMDTWTKQVPEPVTENDGWFNTEYVRLENKVYFPFLNTNAILQFNLDTEEVRIYSLGTSLQGYASIQYDGSCFWLAPRDGEYGKIAKWNPQSNSVEYFSRYPQGFIHPLRSFYKTELINRKFILFAVSSNFNISVDIDTGKIETFPHLCCEEDSNAWRYRHVWKNKELLWIFRSNEWIVWNTLENEIKQTSYQLEEKIKQRYQEKEIKQYFEKRVVAKDAVRETSKFGLKKYLRYIELDDKNEAGE